MAFYRGPQSPRDEQFAANPLSPPQRNPNPNRWSASMTATNDVRGVLPRRFTTNTVPTLTPIGQQRRQAAGDTQQALNALSRISLGERKQRRYEELLDIQRRIQQEIDQVDDDTRREAGENRRREQMVTQLFAQSEPTTPPEYHNTFTNNFTRSNRNSITSFASPPGITARSNRASKHVTSPSNGFHRPYSNGHSMNLPSQSMPGSRRQSDDEDDDFIYEFETGIHRAAANPNRNSLPVTSLDRKRNTTDLSFGLVNTTSFLFDDDSTNAPRQVKSTQTSPPDTKTFLQVQHTADGFPKLIRREDNSDLSISAALDLASTSQQLPESTSGTRHRISLPPAGLNGSGTITPLTSILANGTGISASSRRSQEVKFTDDTKGFTSVTAPARGFPLMTSSYSTNDVPTMNTFKNLNGSTTEGAANITSPRGQNTATTMPASSITGFSVPDHINTSANAEETTTVNGTAVNGAAINGSATSGLQASAVPFGPNGSDLSFKGPYFGAQVNPQMFYYPNMGMPIHTGAYAGMPMGNHGGLQNPVYANATHGVNAQNQWGAQHPGPINGVNNTHHHHHQQQQQPQHGHRGHNSGSGRYDAHQQQRRQIEEQNAQARFNAVTVTDLAGQLLELCKDQHGCRFLQRKLEERQDVATQAIFDEVHNHMFDLMIDPFGNYLCQKLLESANATQRLALVQNAAPKMTEIALNQHGTRALQKMIECVRTPEEVNAITDALRDNVVILIQDLNGNHVIQKCLNHLSSQNAEFIFHAVGNNCVVVGTHRHGCCVLQRCIDHADGLQKGKMVDHVIANVFSLVQDPFGNYVVQYILDLGEPCFTEPLCKAFLGDILTLSRQKFSSNVIEKCIRVAQPETRRLLVEEIMLSGTLAGLIRDGFANYVVQTAMDYAPDDMKAPLMEAARPLIAGLRNTPHGRRIASKLADFDARTLAQQPVALSPLDSITSTMNVTPVAAANTAHPNTAHPRANRNGMIGVPAQWMSNGNGGNAAVFHQYAGYNGNGNGIASPTPQRGNQAMGIFAQNNQANGSDSAFVASVPSDMYAYGNGQAYVNGANQF